MKKLVDPYKVKYKALIYCYSCFKNKSTDTTVKYYILLPCRHFFCTNCMKQKSERGKKCPLNQDAVEKFFEINKDLPQTIKDYLNPSQPDLLFQKYRNVVEFQAAHILRFNQQEATMETKYEKATVMNTSLDEQIDETTKQQDYLRDKRRKLQDILVKTASGNNSVDELQELLSKTASSSSSVFNNSYDKQQGQKPKTPVPDASVFNNSFEKKQVPGPKTPVPDQSIFHYSKIMPTSSGAQIRNGNFRPVSRAPTADSRTVTGNQKPYMRPTFPIAGPGGLKRTENIKQVAAPNKPSYADPRAIKSNQNAPFSIMPKAQVPDSRVFKQPIQTSKTPIPDVRGFKGNLAATKNTSSNPLNKPQNSFLPSFGNASNMKPLNQFSYAPRKSVATESNPYKTPKAQRLIPFSEQKASTPTTASQKKVFHSGFSFRSDDSFRP